MEIILILICFTFLSTPNECGIATLTPTKANQNTPAEVRDVFCEKAQRVLAIEYPGAEITECELWQGTPLGGRKI